MFSSRKRDRSLFTTSLIGLVACGSLFVASASQAGHLRPTCATPPWGQGSYGVTFHGWQPAPYPAPAPHHAPAPSLEAWHLLAHGCTHDAIVQFRRDANDGYGSTSLDIAGGALAKARYGRFDNAVRDMHEAFSCSAGELLFAPNIPGVHDAIARAVRDYTQRACGDPDQWFMIAALKYMARDFAGSRAALTAAMRYGACGRSVDNLRQRLSCAPAW
ncbi:MAG: hypothetical protein KDA25_13615 [Phycisphaerales bacterium]|nr:hypothetical protein [Phycisphaerales bacterium]